MKTITSTNFARRFSSFLAVAIVVSSFQSCVKDNFEMDKIADIQWDPNVAAPLVYASLSIKDMLENSGGQAYVVEAGDGSLTIVYKSSLFSMDASSLVNLPNQSYTYTAAVGAALPTPFSSGTYTVTNTQTVPFISGVGGPLIDSMTLKAGSLFFLFNSDLHNSGSIKITIPSVKKNGVAFSATLPLNYTGSVPVTASGNFDVTGYNFDMTSGGAPYNQFIVKYEVVLTGSATAPSNTENIDVTFSMLNMQFSKICGDIGQLDLSVPSDTIDLTVFTNAVAGVGASFTLVDPRVKVTIANSYGLPIDAHLSTFQGYNPGVNYYPITGFPDPLPIPSPNLSQIGQVLVDSFKLDNTNSNIATIINNTPKQIVYKMDAYTNIGGPTQSNFILDTSRFQMDVEFELPLYGTAKNFVLVDSMPFSFNEDVPDEVESGLIRTYNSNGFPIDINLQVYFVDSLYNTLDSLVSPSQILLKSGTVNPTTGRVTSATPTTFDVTINKARLLKLKNAKNIVIKGSASTTNSGATNVKIYSDYTLGFKLGVQVQMRIQAKR